MAASLMVTMGVASVALQAVAPPEVPGAGAGAGAGAAFHRPAHLRLDSAVALKCQAVGPAIGCQKLHVTAFMIAIRHVSEK
jgi:hypothetical protein